MSLSPFHQLQFTELWEPQTRTGLSIGVQEILLSQQSAFQKVEVLQTDALGKVMLLDGLVMITERDEFVYHEMISHPGLMLLDAPKRVLVVGGGDGGTVREILRHPGIEQVDLVEIDQLVLDAARQFFPEVSSGFADPRLTIHVADGVRFVQDTPAGTYDMVIVDSTDPVGFAEGLFGEAFYRDCARILNEQGILAAQTESPFDSWFQQAIQGAYRVLEGLFPHVDSYLAYIPTYAYGMWSFTMASKRHHPVRDFQRQRAAERLDGLRGGLQYYNADLHTAAFALPTFVQGVMTSGTPRS